MCTLIRDTIWLDQSLEATMAPRWSGKAGRFTSKSAELRGSRLRHVPQFKRWPKPTTSDKSAQASDP